MDVGRTVVLSIIALIYAVTVGISYYLDIFGVLFCVTLPWSIPAIFMMVATLHTYSGNPKNWFSSWRDFESSVVLMVLFVQTNVE